MKQKIMLATVLIIVAAIGTTVMIKNLSNNDPEPSAEQQISLNPKPEETTVETEPKRLSGEERVKKELKDLGVKDPDNITDEDIKNLLHPGR